MDELRSQLAVDPATDWQQVVLTSSANIVIYGTQAGVPTLWIYSLSGRLLRPPLPTEEVLNVLYATPAGAKTTAYEGFVVTGGRKSVVVFRSPHTLEPVQSFFCDDLYPQSIAHGMPSVPVAMPVVVGGAAAAASAGGDATTGAATAAAAAPSPAPKDLWDGSVTSPSSSSGAGASAGSASASTATAAAAAAPASIDPSEAAAWAAHTDPLTAALVADASLSLRMGIASFDIAPSQQHFVVATYPDPFPPVPKHASDSAAAGAGADDDNDNADEDELDSGETDSVAPVLIPSNPAPPSHLEGRLLLFPLPHSSHDNSMLGFYVQVGWATFETVRDALSSKYSDTREMARERLEQVGARLSVSATKATASLAVAKTKIFSAFSGLFGKKGE